MTPRSIRRAAERKARKQEEKAARLAAADSSPIEETVPAISPARLAANRENAQLSTGPRTEEGKRKSSANAVKTALTGRTVLLPSDDVAAYEYHVKQYDRELRPLGARERALVQSIADTDWRLMRIPELEMAIYARGRDQFAEKFAHEDPVVRASKIDLETFLVYEKQLRNLQLQEGRLRRQRDKDLADLRTMQKEREAREKFQLAMASKLYLAAQHDGLPFDPADHGFEFPIDDVKAYLNGARAARIANEVLKAAA